MVTPTGRSVTTAGRALCVYDAAMPSALRAQVALIGLLAVLLIPIGTSSLRGLTHILTCRDKSATPFSVEVPETGPPIISSSTVIERDPSGEVATNEICGGLTLELVMGSRVENRADVTLVITNNSEFGWRGSVRLQLGDVPIPIDIGEIDAGATATDDFEIRLDSGRTYEIEGSLLIGP
jgi:hypothetical protein